jgi:uncharacterized membrane protein YphA (DoxX/SURF4 family)
VDSISLEDCCRRSFPDLKKGVGILAAAALGLIFLIAGLGKLPAQTDAYTILLVLRNIPLMLLLSDYVHIFFPVLEIILGLMLVAGVAAKLTASLSTLLIGAFIFNNLWLIQKGLGQEPCYCFGGSLNWLLGVVSTREVLYVDIGMLGLVCLVMAFYPGRWFDLRPWFSRASEARR